jgi:hypothetical protein
MYRAWMAVPDAASHDRTHYAIARYGSLRKVPGIRGLRDGMGYRGY